MMMDDDGNKGLVDDVDVDVDVDVGGGKDIFF